MATEKSTKSTDEKVVQPKVETKFTVEKLGENCRQLFGVSSCTFAGATHGIRETDLFTVEEMKTRIEKWCKKEVK